MKTSIITLFIIACTVLPDDNPGDWKTARKSERVELQYRWINQGDSLKTREMCIRFSLKADCHAILCNIKEPQQVKRWSVGLRDFRIIRHWPDGWIAYSHYDIPKPLRQQDLVARYEVLNRNDSTVVDITAVPNAEKRYEKIRRIDNYSGKWVMLQNENGQTDVAFYSISYNKPIVPRFVLDLILQPKLIHSFEDFIQLTECDQENTNY